MLTRSNLIICDYDLITQRILTFAATAFVVPTWSTPAVLPYTGGPEPSKQVVVNGWKHIGGYDLETEVVLQTSRSTYVEFRLTRQAVELEGGAISAGYALGTALLKTGKHAEAEVKLGEALGFGFIGEGPRKVDASAADPRLGERVTGKRWAPSWRLVSHADGALDVRQRLGVGRASGPHALLGGRLELAPRLSRRASNYLGYCIWPISAIASTFISSAS